MKTNKMKLLLLILMGVFMMGLVSAENFGYTIYDEPTVSTNYTLVNVNHSASADTWITTEGTLDDVSDISHSWLSDLAWSVAGHIIDGNIDMNDHTLSDISYMVLSGGGYFSDFDGALDIASHLVPYTTAIYNLGSAALRWNNLFLSGNISSTGNTHRLDTVSGNQTLTLDSGGIAYSCLELLEAGAFGFTICNDGAGSNRLVFANYEDGAEWFWIDRDDGTINFLNTTNFVEVNVESINVTDNITASHYFGDGSLLTGISGGNSSWNETHADTLYSNLTNIVNHPHQDVQTTASPSFAGLTVDTDTLYVDSANNRVGIGTTAPGATLHAFGTTFPVILADRSRTDANTSRSSMGVRGTTNVNMKNGFGAGFTFQLVDSSTLVNSVGAIYGVRDGADSTGGLAFHTYTAGTVSPSPRMWIDPTGNVGIGTTTPTHKLNVVGSTNITEHLNVAGNWIGNSYYGEMWYHNHTATNMNFAVDGKFYPLFFTNATHLNGFTYTGGFGLSSNLTAQVSGLYQANYMASGDGQNNHEYYTSIFINEVNQDSCESHKKMTAGGDIVTMVGNCFIDLSVGDKVSVRTADIGGTGTGNYFSSNLNLVRIGN